MKQKKFQEEVRESGHSAKGIDGQDDSAAFHVPESFKEAVQGAKKKEEKEAADPAKDIDQDTMRLSLSPKELKAYHKNEVFLDWEQLKKLNYQTLFFSTRTREDTWSNWFRGLVKNVLVSWPPTLTVQKEGTQDMKEFQYEFTWDGDKWLASSPRGTKIGNVKELERFGRKIRINSEAEEGEVVA